MSDVVIVSLTRGLFARVDASDAGLVLPHKWRVGDSNGGQYARATMPGNPCTYLHRFLVGDACKGLCVDHVNGDTLDNRRANLRVATPLQNMMNMRSARLKRDLSKGATFSAQSFRVSRWCARISAGPRDARGRATRISLGYFGTEEEAALAYDVAARAHFGDFAFCNFPPGTTLEQAIEIRQCRAQVTK